MATTIQAARAAMKQILGDLSTEAERTMVLRMLVGGLVDAEPHGTELDNAIEDAERALMSVQGHLALRAGAR